MIFIRRRRRNKVLIFILVFALILGILFYANQDDLKKVCIEGKACFDVEIADTGEEMALGLSNREKILDGAGMLFVLEKESVPGFWMKDMKFPLDIIWINKNLEISGIVKNFQPCESNEVCPVVYPDGQIAYALEINSGISDLHGLEKGDRIYIE